MATQPQDIQELMRRREYSAGFITSIESETIAPGLSE
ncbi:MAG: Fe-S cluster assembly protein SufB, partial [Nevskia sp.]|nr:Fe-S cluster assembly protein SufB [Nevskia sp.]